MRFSTKLILVCEAIVVTLTIVIGSTIGGMAYEKTRQGIIDSYIYEADNMLTNINLYVTNTLYNQKSLADNASGIVDIFSKDGVYVEVYDKDKRKLAGNAAYTAGLKREELTAAMDNRGQQIFLSTHNDGHYLAFFSQYIERSDDGLLVAVVKDISVLDQQRKDIVFYVVRWLGFGTLLVGALVGLAAFLLLRPVKRLSTAAEGIARGNYAERVPVHGEDEFAALGVSFNLMARAVEDNIAELEERNVAQQQMLDNLTHELRTPLTSIIGYAELLQKMPHDDALFKKGLGYIHSEGRRMLDLNKTLLDLTYYRHKSLKFETQNMNELLYDAQQLIYLRAQKQNVAVYVAEGPAVFAEVAPELIRSLLNNLTDNAVKAMPDGGRIGLSVEADEAFCSVRVLDNGKGMDAEELARIREPFYQVEHARARGVDGSLSGLGLGLAIVDQIVQRHNGQVRFVSAPGEGTEVTVILPLVQNEANRDGNA